MYLLTILGLLGLSAAVLLGTHRRLVRRHSEMSWHVWFFALVLVGLAVGIWFLSIRRLISATEQVWGVPFPVAGGVFIDGSWHNGGVSRFLYFAVLADIACAVALCTAPLALLSFMRNARREHENGAGSTEHGDRV